MINKRITILCGHYGSGKTSVAVNYAIALARGGPRVCLADLDIVNPYFRAHDAMERLKTAGIRFIGSQFAGSGVDVPALPQELYAVVDDRSSRYVLDVGGDDRGALALGRLSGAIKTENDFEMLLVINRCRPLTRAPAEALAVMREIESAADIPFTGIVNNSNLGAETTSQTVLDSLDYAREISCQSGLPIAFTSVRAELYGALFDKIPGLFPIIFT